MLHAGAHITCVPCHGATRDAGHVPACASAAACSACLLSALPIPAPARPFCLNPCSWKEQDDGSRALVPECSHAGHVLALYLATRGDLVIVGEPGLGWAGLPCLPLQSCRPVHCAATAALRVASAPAASAS